jgi:hypothetical protein
MVHLKQLPCCWSSSLRIYWHKPRHVVSAAVQKVRPLSTRAPRVDLSQSSLVLEQNLRESLPVFELHGDDVHVIQEPKDFYDLLVVRTRRLH